MTSIVDENTVLLNWLESKAALTAVTDGRIWADCDTPPAGYKPADGVGICFKVRGGSDDDADAVHSPSFQFKIYGADEAVARSAYRTLHGVLQNAKNHNILASRREGLGATLKEPTGWVYVLVFYSLMIRDND